MKKELQLKEIVVIIRYLNTIDIDKKSKRKLWQIIDEVEECYFLDSLHLQKSVKRGYHLTLWCLKKCEICRTKYDDKSRYRKDKNRPIYGQNVLFSNKRLVKREKLFK